MQIHRVLGRNLKDALHKARRVHGDSAVVLSQESVAGGGIAIAVADPSARRRPCAAHGSAPRARCR